MGSKVKKALTMDDLAAKFPDKLVPFSQDSTVEAKVIQKTKSQFLVDVQGVAIGIVPESEFSYDADDIMIGDTVLAYVLLLENEDGYVILSLRRADKDRVWKTLTQKYQSGETLKVKVSAANRGGLLIEFGGIDGFIPVSQLAPAHYPKVEGGDTNKILSRLKALVGEVLTVKVLTLEPKLNKLIFSEKAASNERLIKASSQLKTGQRLAVQISGLVDFGIFVKADVEIEKGKKEKIDGLIHVSEIAWNKDENWKSKYKIGQTIEAIIVSTDGGKISMSIKRLQDDPWKDAAKQFQPGDKIKGEITRLTPFGAFVKLKKNLDALAHISQISKGKKAAVKEGGKYVFYILKIDPESHRINLSMKKPEAGKTKEKKSTKK